MNQPFELILPQAGWHGLLPRLLVEPGLAAVGRCTDNPHALARELLVHELRAMPAQAAHDETADHPGAVLLAVPHEPQEADPAHWLRRPPRSLRRLLAVLLVGMPPERRGWAGAVLDGEMMCPLEGFRVFGPGMLHVRRGQDRIPQGRSAAEQARWSRTRGAVGEQVWERNRRLRIALFGVGRTGSALAWQLAALGLGQLILIDGDRLGYENLDAMYAVTVEDVGSPKVQAVARQLLRFRPDLAVSCLPRPATDPAVVEVVRSADLLVTCCDNDTPRLLVALLAHRFLRPHLDVGTGITVAAGGERLLAADVRLLLPGDGCVNCVGGLPDIEEARYELLAPAGAMKRGRTRAWDERRAGSLISLNGLAVSLAAQLWLDLLAGRLRQSCWHRLHWVEGEGLRVDHAAVGAAQGCRICHGHHV